MDSTGRIHMYDDLAPTAAPSAERFRHAGFVTKEPMPAACEPRRLLKALDEIADHPDPDGSHPALAPLTPFERGYVLGVLAEYRTWRAGQ